jgi:acetyl-CoA acetyltransferase family protein
VNRAIFLAGLRTPFGRAGKGAYAGIRPDDLAIELIRAHQQRFPAAWNRPPEDFVVGCAYPEGEQGYNLARMIAIGSGCQAPGVTVNRLCASSLDAVAIAAARIKSGWQSSVIVGGVESMSRIPRRGANFSESDAIKSACTLAYIPNGDTAERVAKAYPHLSRRLQEDFAARSHELADQAYRDGFYASQIHPFLIERDEFIRVPVDRAKMQSLEPAFDPSGVVTAATSSPLTDGAACGSVMELSLAAKSGLRWGLEILDVATSHVAPEVMGLGPVPATQLILKRNQLSTDRLAAIEINEAFAIQVLASIEDLKLPLDRVNTRGGAIALGHPLGASGLRLVMTLLNRLAADERDGALGLATLCVGGGQGVSMLGRLVDLSRI